MKSINKALSILAMAISSVSCSFDCLEAWRALPLSSDTDFSLLEDQIKKDNNQWTEVYKFLKNNNLNELSLGRHDIVEGGAFAIVSEYDTKSDGAFEAHRDYIDVQIIANGEENISVANLNDGIDCTMEYNKEKDCLFYASASEIRSHDTDGSTWFVFFPSDLHRPGAMKGDVPVHVKKVVVKIPVR